jgi:putative colanic acid biosynthesis UDP-glucose lipid carrier transferase
MAPPTRRAEVCEAAAEAMAVNSSIERASVQPGEDSFQTDLRLGAARSNESWMKRAIDIVGASVGLIVLGPFLLLTALAIRLESPGPALFRQRRTGRGGETFWILKFRSMTVVEDGSHIVQAAPSDARLTRLGGFLRRSCIDELPQLLNVLGGQMSLVGPRPHAVWHDEQYEQLIGTYRDRFLVRPGIAGLAQVSGYRGATPTTNFMADRVALDREYIANWTLGEDLRILLRAVSDGPFHPAAF